MNRFDAFILSLIGIYFVVFSIISVNRYWQYEVHYMDFGIYDEAIWKVAHFRAPMVDKGDNGQIIFSDHFAPAVFMLSPLYWLTDLREVLLVVQVLAVCAAAWVAFLIAKTAVKNRVVVTALIVAFLGFVGMQNALITEIHEIVYGLPFLMLAFWAIERKRWRVYAVSLFIFLLFKETNATVVVGMGAYILLRFGKKYAAYALGTLAVGILWGVGIIYYLIPALNKGVYAYAPNHLQGKNVWEIASLLINLKIKRDTVFYTFSTFGFLPLFDISLWPMMFIHYFERFVLSSEATRFDMGFHYNSIIVPALFTGAVHTIQKFQKRVPTLVLTLGGVGLITWVLILSRFIYHAPIDLVYNRAFYAQGKNLSYINDFVKLFPDHGVVLTQNNLAPRLTHGPDVRIIRSRFVGLHPDYVILDLTPGQRFVGEDVLATQIKDYYLQDPNYTLTKVHEGQYLFAKNK